MPYGIAKEKGGDSPENEMKMKHCIAQILKAHPEMDKVSAIKICKSQIGNKED